MGDSSNSPCVKCGDSCVGGDSLKCRVSKAQVHRQCVSAMSEECFRQWCRDEELTFLSPALALTPDGSYNFRAALDRVAESAEAPDSIRNKVVRSERLLLETYGVTLPEVKLAYPSALPLDKEDTISTGILQLFHPIILKDYLPMRVTRDGNSMFRGVSLGLYGSEEHHTLIRLLAALEISEHRVYYDSDHPNYRDLIQNAGVICDIYSSLLRCVCRDGSLGEMLHLYGVSAALGIAIESYCPPMFNEYEASKSLNLTIRGRGVSEAEQPSLTLMWSMATIPNTTSHYVPNHFALMYKIDPTDNLDPSDDAPSKQTFLAHHNLSPRSFSQQKPSDISPDRSVKCTDPLSNEEVISVCSHSLPRDRKGYKFLDIGDLVSAVLSPSNTPIAEVPRGVKENVYFLVDNTQNVIRRKQGLKNQFWDDCGSWDSRSSSTNKTTYLCTPWMKLKHVVLQDGSYFYPRQHKKKSVLHPLDPQPRASAIVTVHRYYVKHSQSKEYERRVTWLEMDNSKAASVAVYEFKGAFPGRAPHGSSTGLQEYVRIKPQVLNCLKEAVKNSRPKEVYMEVANLLDGPRSLRNVRDVKYRQRKMK